MKAKAGKALILFFLIMIGFTILSRIADSFTVPKVEVNTIESTSLSFQFYGEGVITSESNHYISIPEGIRVNQVYSSFGKRVEKGETLFLLNPDDIKKKLKAAIREEKKLKIQLEQEKITQISEIDSSDYENAEADYYGAKKEYEEAEREYLLLEKKNREELLKSKASEYQKQKDDLELFKLETESGMTNEKYAMEDAKKDLNQLNIVENGVYSALQSYIVNRDMDKTEADKSLEEIYLWAYGNNIESYEEHKNKVVAAQKKVERAEDSLVSIRLQASLNNSVSSGIAYANSIREAVNGVEDAKDELYQLNLQEVKIAAKAYEYVTLSREGKEETALETLKELNKIVYGETEYKSHMDTIANKRTEYNRLKSSYDNKKQQYQMKEKELLNQLNKLEKECKSLKDGTYDFEEALKTQKETVKATEKAVATAERVLNSAERVYRNQKNEEERESKKSGLRQESVQIDLQENKEDRELLEKLQEKKGMIQADISGVVSNFTLKAGNITASNDIVAIGSGEVGIKGTFSKEDGEYLVIGDEIKFQLKGKNEKVNCNLESITFIKDEIKGDIAEITGKLESNSYDGYALGSILNVEVVKNSDLYPVCVPISALREDASGPFILKTREDNGILGKILITEKVPVQIIEKNKIKAAIQGNISAEDKIIIGSNKMISEGDRVRIK